MPKYSETIVTSKKGINFVKTTVESEGCIFHKIEQENDLGIDAIVELVKDGLPQCIQIGVQIKSGQSFYKRQANQCLIPVGNHFEYWSKYPLSVYGKGNQTRGFLNLKDTMQCVYLSATQPAAKGQLRIFNQLTEPFSVNQLAEKVKKTGDKLGYNVKIKNIENPREEKEDHYYNVRYTGLMDLGLKPHYLTEEVMESFFATVDNYRDLINKDIFFKGIRWK